MMDVDLSDSRNLCVMSAVGVHLFHTAWYICLGSGGIHINMFCFVQAFEELVDYQKENVGLVCLCYVGLC